jgi:cell division protein FtsW (lipid II flippase)
MSIRLARAFSLAGHPFLVIPLLIGATTRNPTWTAVVAAVTVLPMVFVTARNVRRGSWTDFDVSSRKQRPGLYFVAFPLVAVTALILAFMDASPALLRGFAAAGLMLAAGMAANRWLKVSMHMMCGGFTAVAVGQLYPWTAPLLVLFFAAVGWSRRRLERHTWPEIAVGATLGVVAALLA